MIHMRYLKHFAGLLILMLLLQIFAVPLGVTAASYEDIENESLAEMINTLSALKIWGDEGSNTKFNPKGNMTRTEYCDMIIRLLNISDVRAGEDTTYFNDIEAGNTSSISIQTLYALGILNSYTDGSFQPDEPIKYNQAVTILCGALGYNVYAVNGVSHMSIAASKGLLRGVNAGENLNINREAIVKLIYNSLSADYMEQIQFGDKIEFSKSKNVLSVRHKIVKKTGKVTQNSFTGLTSESRLTEGTVMIGGIIYNTGDTLASEFLGYYVNFYVREIEDSERDTLVYISKSTQNNELTVKADFIDPETTSKSLSYYLSSEKDKIIKARISATADIIYNGVACSVYTDNDFKPDEGSIRLLDADGDRVYETVFITSYKTYVVSMVDNKNDIIYDKYNNPPLKLYQNNYVIEKDGVPKKIGELAVWNVLSVAESKGDEAKRKVTISVSTTVVFGKISEVNTDGINAGEVLIDGIAYKYSKSCIKQAEIGTVANFYLTIEGKIIAYDSKTAPQDDVYAYMIGASAGKKLGDKVKFKLFELNGKISVYDSTDKIVVDGISRKTNDDVIEALTWGKIANLMVIDYNNLGSIVFSDYDDGELSQLVKVKFNENMEVTYVDTAFINSVEADESLRNIGTKATYKYKSWERVFDVKFPVGTNTIFISVPTDKTREKNYAIKNSGNYVNDNNYSFLVYDVDEFNIPAIFLEEAATSASNTPISTAPLSIVERVGMVLDEDERLVKRIYIRSLKENTYVDAVNDYAEKDIKRGDIIRYEKNDLMQMSAYEKVLDANDGDPGATIIPSNGLNYYFTNNGLFNEYGALYGKVLKKNVEEGIIILQVQGSPHSTYTFRFRDASSTNQYFRSTKTAAAATLSDIVDVASGGIGGASDVLLHLRYAAPSTMVILN